MKLMLRVLLHVQCRAQGHLVKRIETVERDPRVPRLLAVAEEFRQHKLDTEKYQKAIDVRVDTFDKQVRG